MISRTTLSILLVVVILAAGLQWFLSRDAGPVIPADEVFPEGRWHRAPLVVAPGQEGADLTRVLSLPYLQGKLEAGPLRGVVHHDHEKAWQGLNLYASGHRPEAFLMDMDGNMLHRWQFSFEDAFPGQQGDLGSLYFRRVALLPDGDLLALFQGWGLIRIDRGSSLVWALPLATFNDFEVDGDRILVLSKTARVVAEINPEEPVLEDSIVELIGGREVSRLSLLELFLRSPYAGLLDTMARGGDVLHSNTVTEFDESSAAGHFEAGQILVSLRDVGIVGVIDPSTEEVVWAARGAWRGQHEPVLLANGNILLFDNKGGPEGRARAIEIDRATSEIVWSYGERPSQRLVSPEGGTVARLPNGNTLITVSESGRALEVTSGGEIVWDYFSPHRAGPDNQLVATLWEIVRMDPAKPGWLESDTD